MTTSRLYTCGCGRSFVVHSNSMLAKKVNCPTCGAPAEGRELEAAAPEPPPARKGTRR